MWVSVLLPVVWRILALADILGQAAASTSLTHKFAFNGTYVDKKGSTVSFEVARSEIDLRISIVDNIGTVDIQGRHFTALVQIKCPYNNETYRDWQYTLIGLDALGMVYANLNQAFGKDITGFAELVDTTGQIWYDCVSLDTVQPTVGHDLPSPQEYTLSIVGAEFAVHRDIYDCPQVIGDDFVIDKDCTGKIAGYHLEVFIQYPVLSDDAPQRYLTVLAILGQEGVASCLFEIDIYPAGT